MATFSHGSGNKILQSIEIVYNYDVKSILWVQLQHS